MTSKIQSKTMFPGTLAALVLAAIAGTAFANPDGDQPGILPGRVVRGLQPAEYPPARALSEVIQPTFDNINNSFGLTNRVVLGGGGLSVLEDLNFNPGPWGSAYAGPRLADSLLGFSYQFSGTTVPVDCDIVFDFYNNSSLDFTRVYTPGNPLFPGMLLDNTNSLARLTIPIRALTPGFIYSFGATNLTGLPGGGVSFSSDRAAVRVRAVKPGADPLLPASFMFNDALGQPLGFVNPTSNPAGQPATTQIVRPLFQTNFQVGSTTNSYGRDHNFDGFFNGAAANGAAPNERRSAVFISPNVGGFAIGLSGDVQPPPAPTPVTNIGAVDCNTSSPAAQTASIVIANPAAMPPTPGNITWYQISLPGPVSVLNQTFLNIIASDVNGFGIDPAMGLYNVVGALQKSNNNSGGGANRTDALLTFGIGRFGSVNGSHDLDGNDGDLALVAGPGGDTFYLGVAAGGATFGGGFNVNTTGAIGGTNGDVTITFSSNLSSTGNCPLPAAIAPTIVGANALGILAHGTVTTVALTSGQEDINWITFENDVDISDAGDLSRFVDIDVLGASFFASSAIGVFDSTGALMAFDVESGPDRVSQISFQGAGGPQRPSAGRDGLPYNGQDGPLPIGTYYLAVGSRYIVFETTRWGARSDPGSNLNVPINFRTSSDCRADFNGDGVVNPDDLADFIGAYFSAPPLASADYNGDGLTDPDDLADFIAAYFAGC